MSIWDAGVVVLLSSADRTNRDLDLIKTSNYQEQDKTKTVYIKEK